MLNARIVIGVDVGNLNSGVVALLEGQIQHVKTMDNQEVFEKILSYFVRYKRVGVVIEDIKPFAGNLSQQAIDTCKFIGQLNWRLQEKDISFRMVTRSEIRKWVYNEFPDVVLPDVLHRIKQKDAKNNDGKMRKPSFVYVNDGIVLKAMKYMWKIETPKPGKGYIHGLKTHTWQALALASYFTHLHPTFFSKVRQTSEKTTFFGQKVT